MSAYLDKYGMQMMAKDAGGGDCVRTMTNLMQSVSRLYSATKLLAVTLNKGKDTVTLTLPDPDPSRDAKPNPDLKPRPRP